MKTVVIYRTRSFGGMEGRTVQVRDFETEKDARENALNDTWNDGFALYKVTVTLNGKFEMMGIKLDPICIDNRDIKMLEDLIVAAHKNAMENVQEQIKSKTSSLVRLNIIELSCS